MTITGRCLRGFLVFLMMLLAIGAAAAPAPAAGNPCDPVNSTAAYAVEEIREEWAMQDGTKLPVSVFSPLAEGGDADFPMIVFVHPLGTDILFYDNAAREYAAAGYVTVTYGVRGSFGAEGQFHIIDPNIELADLSHIITLVCEDGRFPVLRDGIGPVVGVAGYSMGGVHSFLIAPRKNPRAGDPGDPRVRAVVPIHGGADLLYSILPNGAPSILVGGVILGGCYLQNLVSFAGNIGNIASREDMGGWEKISAAIAAAFRLARQPLNDVDPKVAWAVGVFMRRDIAAYAAAKDYIEQRSVRYWCDEEYDGVVEHPITAPMLIVTGWNDDAFYPNQGLRILSECLEAPGRMIITNHGHLGGIRNDSYIELPGDPDNLWVEEQVRMWFDHYLKGIDNGVEDQPRVAFYRDRDPEHYGEASDYPLPGTMPTRFYLDGGGRLSADNPAGGASGQDFLLNLGITGSISLVYYQDLPELLGWEALDIPKKIDLFEIPFSERGYVSERLASDLTIMGPPQMEVFYQSSQPFTQLNLSLYEVAEDGREILVSRGGYEGYEPKTWSLDDTTAKPIEMQACYHRFPAGSRIKLEIATADLVGTWPNWGLGFILLHHGGGTASRLVLPVVPNTY